MKCGSIVGIIERFISIEQKDAIRQTNTRQYPANHTPDWVQTAFRVSRSYTEMLCCVATNRYADPLPLK